MMASTFCYYGLSPEDEAESAANKMWKDGIRNPIVAMPQNDLGQGFAMMASTFCLSNGPTNALIPDSFACAIMSLIGVVDATSVSQYN